ncbi:MAG TPA: hypothetical protein VN606_10645 [Thermoleophilaceae bacterium]|jgi:hypothetical protein|nr:hypothetical protein [Thermoleophilaceae bacterium]
MPVAVIMDFEDTSLEQYDEVIGKMGFSHGGPGAKGGLFHWVTQTNGGIRVTDVWESKEEFERYSESTIAPLTAEAGIQGPPKVTYAEVYNYLTAG